MDTTGTKPDWVTDERWTQVPSLPYWNKVREVMLSVTPSMPLKGAIVTLQARQLAEQRDLQGQSENQHMTRPLG